MALVIAFEAIGRTVDTGLVLKRKSYRAFGAYLWVSQTLDTVLIRARLALELVEVVTWVT